MMAALSTSDFDEFIEVIPFEDYVQLTHEEVQQKIRNRHLIITGRPGPHYKFDEEGLSRLTLLENQVTLHGIFYFLNLLSFL